MRIYVCDSWTCRKLNKLSSREWPLENRLHFSRKFWRKSYKKLVSSFDKVKWPLQKSEKGDRTMIALQEGREMRIQVKAEKIENRHVGRII